MNKLNDENPLLLNEKQFERFDSIKRLSRECVVTEKIDGTNATVKICEDGELLIGSRSRWITPGKDNFGFAKWVMENEECIRQLGPGTHRGEWWGAGIQRGYGLQEDRIFSLFNTSVWNPINVPECCNVVPVLYSGPFCTQVIDEILEGLNTTGSYAISGYMNPEGIVVYHTHARIYLKKTLDKNDSHKFQLRGDDEG